MKATVHVNGRGTLTLPMALRKRFGLSRGGELMAEVSEQGIVLRPFVAYPIEMYSDDRVREFDQADAELGEYLEGRKVP
jgi:bifunctional DNA-binding transcriptional regulator/antitoxin component of YhaV-PrlF toxin-antitoxin module